MIRKILLVFLFTVSIIHSYTIKQLNNPVSSVFDITKDPVFAESSIPKIMQEVEKIVVSVDKINAIFPRDVAIHQCGTDSYNNIYCPVELMNAETYWDYNRGYGVESTSTVTDYALGTSTQKGSLVSDYSNGTAIANYNSETINSNGTSVAQTGTVVDYTAKEGSVTYLNPELGIEFKDYKGTAWYKQSYFGDSSSMGSILFFKLIVRNGDIYRTMANDSWPIFGPEQLSSQYTMFGDQYGLMKNGAWPGFDMFRINNGNLEGNTCSRSGNNYICLKLRYQWTKINENDVFSGAQPTNATYPSWGLSYSYYNIRLNGTCSSGTLVTIDGQQLCAVGSSSCPSGYTDNGTNCKKTVSYTYYSYSCPSGYTTGNAGLSSCSKTDPNNTIVNSTLADACNSATPPANNCSKVLNSTAYSYSCPSGYTVINNGLTSCPSGTSGACNSSSSPASNCVKEIGYSYYSYSCPSGYTTGNAGLSSCSKTDPNNTIVNSTLADACNSATPPANNCSKVLSYPYYKYLCYDTPNEFLENYTPLNTGLSSCSKTDPNNTIVNSTLADACNSATPPANNCKRLNFTCQSFAGVPAFVGGGWKCSPYVCDANKKCGIAQCINGTPQHNGTNFDLSPLLGTNLTTICNNTTCDAGLFEKLGRCGSESRCPTAHGVYQEGGNCYQDVCPPGATERELGGGEIDCLMPQCPNGYIENASGGCDAQ